VGFKHQCSGSFAAAVPTFIGAIAPTLINRSRESAIRQ